MIDMLKVEECLVRRWERHGHTPVYDAMSGLVDTFRCTACGRRTTITFNNRRTSWTLDNRQLDTDCDSP